MDIFYTDANVAVTFVSSLRLTRLFRLAKLLNIMSELRVMTTAIFNGISSIIFITLLLMLTFYIYAIIGVITPHNLRCKLNSSCQFLKPIVELLGHNV